MNRSTTESSHENQLELRKAVEEQLDLILKMQEERKVLKKQNKMLTHQLKTTTAIVEKYRVETNQEGINTDPCDQFQNYQQKQLDQYKQTQSLHTKQVNHQQSQLSIEQSDQSIQVDQIQNNPMLLNCSKLTEAQSLLKAIDLTQINETKIQQHQQQSQQVLKQKPLKKVEDKKISNEIVKMSKQINSLKRQFKESQQKVSQKDKQINNLKKCLQNKGQALEKSRKEFNELSNLLNSDKYKSVRMLEQQVCALRSKVAKQEDSGKLMKVLEGVTAEYEEYKREMEKKIDILVQQLAAKEKQSEELKIQQKRVLRMLDPMTTN